MSGPGNLVDPGVTAAQWLADRAEAIDDLLDKVAGEALGRLSCLSLGSQQQVRARLAKVVDRAVRTWFSQGVIVAETDGTFLVAVGADGETGEVLIDVCLNLAEGRISR